MRAAGRGESLQDTLNGIEAVFGKGERIRSPERGHQHRQLPVSRRSSPAFTPLLV
jgi:hypothetical protein